MTREIKFRAWDKDEKEMKEIINIGFYDSKSEPLVITGIDRISIPNYELMQYTGIKDKNGKEIYEGDIVEWKYLKTWHKNEVRWVGGGFVVTTSGFKDDLNEPQDLLLVSILSCEVIGNIYENPELLNTNNK